MQGPHRPKQAPGLEIFAGLIYNNHQPMKNTLKIVQLKYIFNINFKQDELSFNKI